MLPPLTGLDGRRGVVIENREVGPDDGPTRAHPRVVTSNYLQAIGARVREGRGFTAGRHRDVATGGDRQRDDGEAVLARRVADRQARALLPIRRSGARWSASSATSSTGASMRR